MKKKLMYIIFVLGLISNEIISQTTPEKIIASIWGRKPTISSDSLLKKFKKMEPFAVLDSTDLYNVDIYDCYQNKELWPYLLKWLDKEEYFNYSIKVYIKRAFSEEYKKNEVVNWLKKHNQKELIDSVLNTPELFQKYVDSVIMEETKFKYRTFYRYGGILPQKALDFHAKLKLSEAYEILRRYWKEDGGSMDSDYFFQLLAMHDPEAIKMYDAYLDSVIAMNDLYKLEKVQHIATNIYEFGSYAVELLLKLLTVTTKSTYETLEHYYYDAPYNITLLSPFEGYCYFFTRGEYVPKLIELIYGKGQMIKSKDYNKLEIISKEIKENIEEFRYSIEPFKDALIKREEYWKKNMPYYKEQNSQ